VVAVNINVEVTAAKGALNQIKAKIPNASRKALNKTGMFLQNAIKNRTAKGRDFKGRAFKPYSKAYAEKRKRRNATLKPNLFFKGLMLGNMSFKTFSKTKGQIFFPNTNANKKAFFNDKTRPFFSVNKKEEDKAVKIFTESLMRDLKI